MNDRDLKGRFIHGHSPIADRDPITGRFIATKDKTDLLTSSKEVNNKPLLVETDEYIKARIEVDKFLKEKQLCR